MTTDSHPSPSLKTRLTFLRHQLSRKLNRHATARKAFIGAVCAIAGSGDAKALGVIIQFFTKRYGEEWVVDMLVEELDNYLSQHLTRKLELMIRACAEIQAAERVEEAQAEPEAPETAQPSHPFPPITLN